MTQVQWNADKTSGAVISDDDKYRFALYRVWDWTKPWLVYVLLNPSTAGAEVNDPTSRVCVGRAKKLGYGGIIMVNLFAWRETDSRLLGATRLGYGNERIVKDLVGADNDRYIVDAAHGDVWTTPSSKRLVVVTCKEPEESNDTTRFRFVVMPVGCTRVVELKVAEVWS